MKKNLEKTIQNIGLYRYLPGDRNIWVIILLLSLVSILVVYSSTGMLAYRHHPGHSAYYALKHTGMIISGWLIIYVVSRIPYTYFSRIGWILFWLAVPLLVLTLAMPKVNDASRWLEIPVLGITFQTSDLAKLALLMYLARMLAKKQSTIGEKQTFYQVVWPPLLICALIFPENLSTSALLMMTSWVMMMFGGVRTRYLLGLFGVFVLAAGLMLAVFYFVPEDYLPGRFATWKARIENFTSPEESEGNYQATQAKIAVAGGGLIGKMPGNGIQRNFLPHPYSDYVYAIVVEEYGMVGGVAVLLLYLWFIRRGIKIARQCQGSFGCFLVLGVCFMFTLQALVNMGVAVNLLPVTGQILPFVSMGGTAMWFNSFGAGLVLSVSAAVEKQKEKGKALAEMEKADAVNE